MDIPEVDNDYGASAANDTGILDPIFRQVLATSREQERNFREEQQPIMEDVAKQEEINRMLKQFIMATKEI